MTIARAIRPVTPELSQRALEQLGANPSIPPRSVYGRVVATPQEPGV